jgi:CHASE2 domain-containing sensor protein
VGLSPLKGLFVKQVQPLVAVIIFLIGYLMVATGGFLLFGPIPLIPLGVVLAVTGILIDIKE